MTKLTLFLVFVFSIGVHASGTAQQVTLAVKNTPITEVLTEVKKQTNYHFLYSEDLLRRVRPITLSLRNEPMDIALNKILTENGLNYRVRGNTVTILRRATPPPSTNNVQPTEVEVRGTVTDTAGNVLQGVNISIKDNPQRGTSTDVNGRYILDVPHDAVLVFRYLGYIGQEISIDGRTVIDVRLEADATGLEEVVVIGFGQQKKESLVSSVATVSGEQLRMPTRSLSNNLAGQIPGLIAVQRSGEPGYDNAEFWIRGISSFAGGTSPLVLVDGVPRSMNDIEPDEIETFTLLKDAAATAVYGAEGANGVVLITSKRGRVQKTNISYRGEYSTLQPTRLPSFMGAAEYLSLYDEATRNEGREAIYEDMIPFYLAGDDRDLYPDVNWMSLLRDNTHNTRHTLNFRGGGDKARFFVSGAYFNESGIFEQNPMAQYNNNIGLNRYNLRSNIDLDVTASTLLRIDLSGQYLETNYPGIGTETLFQRMTIAPPHLFPMVYSDGSSAAHPRFSNNRTNPYNLLMESGYAKEWRTGIQSRVDLEQKLDVLTEGLRVRGTVSYDANSMYTMNRTKTPEQFVAVGRDIQGDLILSRLINEVKMGEPNEGNSGNKNLYIETAVNYANEFAGKHAVSGMALYYQKSQQLHNEALAFKKQAYVGRATYMYDNRYSIEANFGFTGSETFAEGYRFGFFPAVGVAWVVTNEPYFPEQLRSSFNSLKFRASVGRTGNDNVGGARFLYRPTYGDAGGYPYGIGGSGGLNSIGGIVEGRFAAPLLSWEIELKRNYGIDLSMFQGRIDLQADYFHNDRSNILLQRRTVSDAAGFRQAPWQNYGHVTNKGVDVSLNLRHNFTQDLTVGLRGNLTYARNRIVEYDEIPQLYPWMNVTDTRLGIPNLFVAERLYTNDDFNITENPDGTRTYTLRDGLATSTMNPVLMPGDIKYQDLNGDGIINQFDQTRQLGNPNVPELIYGFGINADFKGFYANVFFQGAGNTSTVLGGQNPQGFFPFNWGIDESSVRTEVRSRWTEENPSQDVMFPRVRTSANPHNNAASTWWLRDASFIRLKNVELGYQFQRNWISQYGFTAARLYLMGHNIAVWDQIKMWDPEMGNANAGMNYPLPSIWTIGLELTL